MVNLCSYCFVMNNRFQVVICNVILSFCSPQLAVDFFNQINMLYGTITEFCSEQTCSVMSAGPKYEYHWADGHTIKKPIKCSAPKYIDYLMTWVQDQLDDEALFPSKIGTFFGSFGMNTSLGANTIVLCQSCVVVDFSVQPS